MSKELEHLIKERDKTQCMLDAYNKMIAELQARTNEDVIMTREEREEAIALFYKDKSHYDPLDYPL